MSGARGRCASGEGSAGLCSDHIPGCHGGTSNCANKTQTPQVAASHGTKQHSPVVEVVVVDLVYRAPSEIEARVVERRQYPANDDKKCGCSDVHLEVEQPWRTELGGKEVSRSPAEGEPWA